MKNTAIKQSILPTVIIVAGLLSIFAFGKTSLPLCVMYTAAAIIAIVEIAQLMAQNDFLYRDTLVDNATIAIAIVIVAILTIFEIRQDHVVLILLILLDLSYRAIAHIGDRSIGTKLFLSRPFSEISPHKTWEGIICGVFCSIFVGIFYLGIGPNGFMSMPSKVRFIVCFGGIITCIGDLYGDKLNHLARVKNPDDDPYRHANNKFFNKFLPFFTITLIYGIVHLFS